MTKLHVNRRNLFKLAALGAGWLALGRVGGVSAAAQTLRANPTEIGPLAWTPLSPIHSVSATDGRVHVPYELHVTNESHYNVRITSIGVLDARTRQPTGTSRIVSSDGQDVSGRIRPFALPATMTAADYKDQLAPGQAGILYVDLTYPALRDVPARIHHRFVSSVAIEDKPPQVFDVVDGGYLVIRTEPIVIAPPFKGSNWLVANGAGPIISPHRYTVQSANGMLWPPEHFAIDFIQLNAQDLAYAGDPSNVKSWLYYGTEIAAVARGRVAEVRDNMPDQVPGQPSTPLKADDYAGNHVIVDMGNGSNALYAHLAPGSIVVRKGEMVRTGQPLGTLGNTGNSDAPHLHFQIMDSPTVLNTVGLPFVLDRMTYQGKLSGTLDRVGDTVFAGKPPAIDTTGVGNRRRQMPLTLDLIGFG